MHIQSGLLLKNNGCKNIKWTVTQIFSTALQWYFILKKNSNAKNNLVLISFGAHLWRLDAEAPVNIMTGSTEVAEWAQGSQVAWYGCFDVTCAYCTAHLSLKTMWALPREFKFNQREKHFLVLFKGSTISMLFLGNVFFIHIFRAGFSLSTLP